MTILKTYKLLLSCALFLFISFAFSQNKYNIKSANKKEMAEKHIEESEENDSKVIQLGEDIINTIYESDVEAYMSFFDTSAFTDLMMEGIKEDPSTKDFIRGFLSGLKEGIAAIPKKIIKEIEAESYYDLVNYRYDEDTKTYYILYRIYSPETGVNYHDYRVSKLNNKFVFNDIFIYLSGEELSKTYRRFYIYNLPRKSLLDLFGKSNADEFLVMIEAVTLYNNGEFIKAHEKLKDIGGDLKNDKFVLIIKAICASNISDDEYRNSLKTIAEIYPNDSSLFITQIDYHIMNENYDVAITLLDKLKSDTDDDFLNLFKGNIEYERKNYEKSIEYFKNISDINPDFFEGHSSYLACLAITEKFDECIKLLSFLVEDGYEKSDLIEFVEELDENGENILEGLAKSDLYKKWKTN